jgi:hypothetical protein
MTKTGININETDIAAGVIALILMASGGFLVLHSRASRRRTKEKWEVMSDGPGWLIFIAGLLLAGYLYPVYREFLK